MHKSLIIIILSLLFFSGSVFSVNDGAALKIIDFKQGLMREQSGIHKVYQLGSKFQYQTNGECTYNHKQYNCMWFGFSFRTSQDVKKLTLSCKGTLSSPDDIGNPQGVLGKQSQNIEVTLVLKGKNRYFSNPQYIIKEPNITTQELTTTCSHNGKVILKSNVTINFGA